MTSSKIWQIISKSGIIGCMGKHLTLITLAVCASLCIGQKAAFSEENKSSEVLDPNQFSDPTQILVKKGYAAAKAIPDICAKIFCFCGCDITDKHTSLLDCFTSDHGVGCPICIEEALIALQMNKKGKTICEIQFAIDRRYEKQYPFDSPSESLKKYRAERLWDADKKPAQSKPAHDGQAPSLKKNKKTGNCCGGSDEHKPTQESDKKNSK